MNKESNYFHQRITWLAGDWLSHFWMSKRRMVKMKVKIFHFLEIKAWNRSLSSLFRQLSSQHSSSHSVMILKLITIILVLIGMFRSSNGQFGISSLGVGPTHYPPSSGSFRPSPYTASASAPGPYSPYGPGTGYPPHHGSMYSPYTTTFSSPPQYSAQLAPPFQSSNQFNNNPASSNNNGGGSSNNNNSNGGLFGGGRLLSRIFPNRGEGENRGLLGLGSNRGSLLSRLRGTSSNNNNNSNNNNAGNTNNNPMNQNMPVMNPGYGFGYNPYALGAQNPQVHLFPPSSHPHAMGHHHGHPMGPPPPPYDGPDEGPEGPPGGY